MSKEEAENQGLVPHHRDLVTWSAISSDVACERGYRSITTKTKLGELGFQPYQQRTPALLIPVWNIHGQIANYQARPDDPRIDSKSGKAIKYETVAGSRMCIDVPPRIRPQLADPTTPLYITEGVRKADSAVSRSLCCIDLLGVWNWRGTNEFGGKTALADWELIALNDRDVFIAFDSDVMTRPQVHLALTRLKAFLESRGAKIKVIYLPDAPDGSKVGLDDFFAGGGSVDQLLELAQSELKPCAEAEKEERYTIQDGQLAQIKDGEVKPLCNFTAEIVEDITLDDGAETVRNLKIQGRVAGSDREVEIVTPATQFPAVGWVSDLGSDFVPRAGWANRDRLREAVQVTSYNTIKKTIYTHLGWTDLDGKPYFLHAGGAIGPDGPVPEGTLHTVFDEPLDRFYLPEPGDRAQLERDWDSYQKLYEVAPADKVVPLFVATFLPIIHEADFSLFIVGPTGEGKTELASLAQRHFGPGMSAKRLPGSWLSTANALEGLAFLAKDVLLIIDDFAPGGTTGDIDRLHRQAERLLRAQGNKQGRGRMRPDASLRPTKVPRGLIFSTGEDIPRGQSLRARLLIIEIGPGDVNWGILTQCQEDAAAGAYARIMARFIQWVTSNWSDAQQAYRETAGELRKELQTSPGHRRTASIIANLKSADRTFGRFLSELGLLPESDVDEMINRHDSIFDSVGLAQNDYQMATDPVNRFLSLLAAALTSGLANVAQPDGNPPANAEMWGWRKDSGGNLTAKGDRVGWVASCDLYLDPEASYKAVQQYARTSGEPISVSSQTLRKRLYEKGLLLSRDENRGRFTVRMTINGERRSVLHLHRDSVVKEQASLMDVSQRIHSGKSELGIMDLGDQNAEPSKPPPPRKPRKPKEDPIERLRRVKAEKAQARSEADRDGS